MLRDTLNKLKGKREQLHDSIKNTSSSIREIKRELRQLEEAKIILQRVATETQKELEYKICSLASTALDAIFPDAYKLNVEFIIKRGKSECFLTFSRKDSDNQIDPMTESGGGAVDVAAFALRLTLWSIQEPKTRNTIVLDEPFRFLSTDLQPKASEMLKTLSQKLNLQFIIITHEEELVESADKVFRVSINNGISKVVASAGSSVYATETNVIE